MLTVKLTWELFMLTWVLFRPTGVLIRLTGVFFRLTWVPRTSTSKTRMPRWLDPLFTATSVLKAKAYIVSKCGTGLWDPGFFRLCRNSASSETRETYKGPFIFYEHGGAGGIWGGGGGGTRKKWHLGGGVGATKKIWVKEGGHQQ